MILDAERFKESVQSPPGTCNFVQPGAYSGNDDDTFFHVTCHLDPVLKNKIAKGEFVELDRLLPKQRNSGGFSQEEQRMNIVHREGQTYFVPAQNQLKVNSIRRWEQAFRVYAAVYSEANPSRAAEIWQYIHVINIAASAYTWENVYFYDVTFRQLMASNPSRPWSKIYNQMWSIAMREPLVRSNGSFQQHSGSYQSNQNNGQGQGRTNFSHQQQSRSNANTNNNTTGGGDSGKRKPKYCWAHNRANGYCKDGNKCRFIHRCSYCDKPDHGINICPKKS